MDADTNLSETLGLLANGTNGSLLVSQLGNLYAERIALLRSI